jgi:CRP-like cAMP-binding protein
MRTNSSSQSHNRILNSLPADEFQRLAPHLRAIPMTAKSVIQRQDEPIQHVYFPCSGAVSFVKTLSNGQQAEVAVIGDEGAVGADVFYGERMADCEAIVHIPGQSLVVSADCFSAEMEHRSVFFNHVIRYNQALMAQVIQTTACNGLHSAEQRCCRWLLMSHDRAGADALDFTHEFLASMLGLRRPTVTLILTDLQRAGILQTQRGRIHILDRARLEASSCECYRAIRGYATRLVPELSQAVVS